MFAALSLVYECYAKRGLVAPNKLRLRLRRGIELTQRLTMFGAFDQGALVATLGVIADGEGGLPAERLLVDAKTVDSCAEFTNLAGSRLTAILPLFEAVDEWCRMHGVTTAYAQVSPSDVRLYGRIGFLPLGDPIDVGDDRVQVMAITRERRDIALQRRAGSGGQTR